MKLIALWGLFVAAGSSATDVAGLPPWAYGAATIIGSLGWLRFYAVPRMEKRVQEAAAQKTDAETGRTDVQAAHEAVDFVRQEFQRARGELDEMRVQLTRERDRADTAHSQLTAAQAALAQAQATLTETVARASMDRESLHQEVTHLKAMLTVARTDANAVREQLDTVHAMMGAKERRSPPGRREHDDDEPPRTGRPST